MNRKQRKTEGADSGPSPYERERRRLRVRRSVPILIITGLLAALVIVLASRSGIFSRWRSGISFELETPGRFAGLGLMQSGINQERMLLGLETELSGPAGGVQAARWLDPGSARYYPQDSTVGIGQDQADYLLLAAETGDRQLFDQQLEAIDGFITAEGLIRGGLTAEEEPAGESLMDQPRSETQRVLAIEAGIDPLEDTAGTTWPTERLVEPDYGATVTYMRALVMAYQNWGSTENLDRLKRTADAYLAACEDDLPPVLSVRLQPTPTPPMYVEPGEGLSEDGTVLDGTGPTDEPPLQVLTPEEIEQQQEAAQEGLPVILLADTDPALYDALAELDPAYAVLAENSRRLIRDAYISDEEPFYRPAYNPSGETYYTYLDEAVYTMSAQLDIALADSYGRTLSPAFCAWLRLRLDEGMLAETYAVRTLVPDSQERLPAREGEVMRLARQIGDRALYERAEELLERSAIGNVSLSPAYGLVFRQLGTTDDIVLTAEDNLSVLLGLN